MDVRARGDGGADGLEVRAHRPAGHRIARLVAAQHGDGGAVSTPARGGLLGEDVRGREHEDAGRQASRAQALAELEHVIPSELALAEADGGSDPDLRRVVRSRGRGAMPRSSGRRRRAPHRAWRERPRQHARVRQELASTGSASRAGSRPSESSRSLSATLRAASRGGVVDGAVGPGEVAACRRSAPRRSASVAQGRAIRRPRPRRARCGRRSATARRHGHRRRGPRGHGRPRRRHRRSPSAADCPRSPCRRRGGFQPRCRAPGSSSRRLVGRLSNATSRGVSPSGQP